MIKTALFGTSRCQNGTEWHLFSITGPPCKFPFQSPNRNHLARGITPYQTITL